MKTKISLFFAGVFASLLNAATTVNPGQAATFTVTADGTQPFTYSWRKDGVVLAGKTASSFILSNVQASDAGSYVATVTNSAGTTTSAPADLVVGSVTAPSTAFARVNISLPWTPLPLDFYTAICNNVAEDPGRHYDPATGFYTIGANEGGRYRIMVSARPDDTAASYISFGLGAGTTNADSPSFGWKMTNPPSPIGLPMRHGAQHIIEATFNAGDKLRAFVYTQSSIKFNSLEIIFEKVN